MSRIRVKIEGLRDPQTAVAAARLGADWIGLVFAKSPRRVTVRQAKAIRAALPARIKTVGVFVNAAPGRINKIVREVGIDYVQLHGDEKPAVLEKIEARCIKAFRVREQRGMGVPPVRLAGVSPARTGRRLPPDWLIEVSSWLSGVKDRRRLAYILLDAYDPQARGGTGKSFNWELIRAAGGQAGRAALGKFILAGGLNPDNVARAIRIARPHVVDVASGVESAPGVKDLAKVAAFIRAAKNA